jgi:two-component system chemotaxis response regulator CheY
MGEVDASRSRRTPLKVLALDDDRLYLQMVRAALEEEGHQVALATSGEAALELLGQETPDVILLDIRMPRMNGRAFARAYASRPGPHAPLIVVSGAGEAAMTGVNVAGYLAKPFELDALLHLLREVDPAA